MRGLKDFSMIAFLTGIGVTTILVAQLQAGCFKQQNTNCSAGYNTANPYPYGVNQAADCTQNACGCSGNPSISAGEETPSDCGCAGIVTVHVNVTITGAFPCAAGMHNNCKDNWTIKLKGNGEPDEVECGTVKSCDGCESQYLKLPNGERYFVQNICGPPGSANPIIANQAEVVGDPLRTKRILPRMLMVALRD